MSVAPVVAPAPVAGTAPVAPTQTPAQINLEAAETKLNTFSYLNFFNPTPEYTTAKQAVATAKAAVDAEKEPTKTLGGRRRKSAKGKRCGGGKSKKNKRKQRKPKN
jgi:hypothetical protein